MSWIDEAEVRTVEDKATEIAEEARTKFKADRAMAVSQIVITTESGNTFDGDEASQGRMARAIVYMNETGQNEIQWVLADNTIAIVTRGDLSEALKLSVDAQTTLWLDRGICAYL